MISIKVSTISFNRHPQQLWTILVLLSTFSCWGVRALEQTNSIFSCGEIFCTELEKPCTEPRNCTTQPYREYLSPQECNCCPGSFCIDYIEENKVCSQDSLLINIDLCGPHLTCPKGVSVSQQKCIPMTGTPCMDEVKSYQDKFEDGTIGTAQFLPECTAVGAYAPKQCLPGSICYCTNLEGQRIFGLGLHLTQMDCQCSRDIDMLTRINSFSGKLPHCLSTGDYDALQCVGRMCWCRQNPDEQKVLAQMNQLPCYNKEIHPMKPTPYLRDCDYAKAQIELERIKALNESVTLLVADEPRCDPDGHFGPVQSQNGHLICVDPKGRQIDDYEVDKKSRLASKMDCHCARVRQIMENSVNGLPTCCKIGNFRRWQCTSSLCYCVDKDGKQIVTTEPHEVPIDDVDLLSCKQESSEDDDCAY